jgi:hypothetical protein
MAGRQWGFPRLNETVDSLAAVSPDLATSTELTTAIRTRARKAGPAQADRMGRAVWYRYCAPEPLSYPEIGEALGVSPQHARRLAARGLDYLKEADLRPRRGSRLDRALRDGRVL